MRIQATIDLEYESADQRPPQLVMNDLQKNFRKAFEDITDYEIPSWSIEMKLVDKNKEPVQIQVNRCTPFADITAYFSGDGPAFAVALHGIPAGAATDAMDLTLSDINAALREAHHKYLAKLRED